MKILEIIPQLHMGGAEKFTVDLSNELARRGNTVILVVTNSVSEYGYFARYLHPDIELISLDKRKGPDMTLFFRLTKLIKQRQPDIVHTHLGAIFYNCFSPYFYKKAKYIHTIHNEAKKEALTFGRLGKLVRKVLFQHNRVIPVSISKQSLNSFFTFYGDNIKSELIFNGVPDESVNPTRVKCFQKNSICIVNVARVMEQKNQISLVRAVENLNQKGYSVNLYIVGYNDTIEGDKIRSMNCTHSHLLGPKDNPRDYIAASDAFVLASNYEGMPLTLIECFSVGTIPICSPVGGILDMIQDGKNGILARGASSEMLEEAILRFISLSEEEKLSMRKKSLQTYSKYSMERCASDYINLFKRNI